jgi:hypothetical protein
MADYSDTGFGIFGFTIAPFSRTEIGSGKGFGRRHCLHAVLDLIQAEMERRRKRGQILEEVQ